MIDEEKYRPTALVPATASTEIAVHVPSERTREAARHAMSPGTLRNYASHCRNYEKYCAEHGVEPWPADPVVVANWLTHRAETGAARGRRMLVGKQGTAVASLRGFVAAIKFKSKVLGHRFDGEHEVLEFTLKGLARTKAEETEQAAPMSGELLSAIFEGFTDEHLSDIRDLAMLGLGYSLGRRRSELVGLDLERLGTGNGVLRRKATTIELTLVKHKTMSSSGEPLVFVMPLAGNQLVAEALDRWITAAGIKEGEALFRHVAWQGTVKAERLSVSGGVVSEAIKKRVFRFHVARGLPEDVAWREAQKFSGHSLRVGLATSAANAGADIRAIQDALGHASPAMSARYARKADKLRNSVLKLDGVALGKKPTDAPLRQDQTRGPPTSGAA